MSLLNKYREIFVHCNWFACHCSAIKTKTTLKFSGKKSWKFIKILSFYQESWNRSWFYLVLGSGISMCCSMSEALFPEAASQGDNAAEHCSLFITGGTNLAVSQGEMEPGRISLQACNTFEISTLWPFGQIQLKLADKWAIVKQVLKNRTCKPNFFRKVGYGGRIDQCSSLHVLYTEKSKLTLTNKYTKNSWYIW